MIKNRLSFLICLMVAIFIAAFLLPGSSFSSVSGKAKGAPILKADKPVKVSTCLDCHATVKMLYLRGGHKNLNCAHCHEVPADHVANPSEKTRPKTEFSHESCGRCHVNEYKSMHSDKYHREWTKKNPNMSYMIWRDPGGGPFSHVQGYLPRYHVSVLYDLAVTKSGGRLQFKDGLYGYNKIGGRLWDAIYDAYPEDGNEIIKVHIPTNSTRPHKQRTPRSALFNSSICMTCKTGQQILDWPYMGEPHEKAQFNRTTPGYEVLKAVNYGMTCNLCHDPHSAEPRVIRDGFIRTLSDPEFKDNIYQSNPQKTKIEVIDMGARGFVRKIAILEKYDSNLQCGQCHLGSTTAGAFDSKTGKFISSREVPGMVLNCLMPIDKFADWYKARGLYVGKDPVTGARLYGPPSHPHYEVVTASKHGKAGVGCTNCHYATEKDQKTKRVYKSHQASLPIYKIQQTCLNVGCHGKGSRQNWTEEDALYNVKVIQHLQRKRLIDLEFQLNRIVAGIVTAQRIGIDKSVIEKAKDAQSEAFLVQNYWVADYSNGMHNPELSEQTLTKAIQEAEVAYEELNRALKEKGAEK